MIEVVRRYGGWTWRFISEEGREVYISREKYLTDKEANEAAKRVRASFWQLSKGVDEH